MKNAGIQLRISDLLFAIQKRWKIILSLTALGFVFGLLLSAMTYVQSSFQTYQVSGSFMIDAANENGQYSSNSSSPNRNDMTLAEDLYDIVYYLLRSDRLLNQVINDEQMLGVSPSDIRSGLSISRYNETSIISMKLTWANGEEGLAIWESILATGNTLMRQIVQLGRLRIINDAEVSMVGMGGTNAKTWMALPVLGFMAGIGFAVVEVLTHPTLINVKDVETVFGLETLGIIPYDEEYFHSKTSILVKDESTSSEVTQNYAAAAYILRNRIGSKERSHVFYVTSAGNGEGRTTAAANLAIQLSDMEHHTLLIDFDYKSPTLGTLFLNNLDYTRSLNALYRGEISDADAITTLTGYLDILPMVLEHNLISLDSTIIDLVDRMRKRYEYIIFDAPPVGKEAETLSLNRVANTVLFVAGYNMSTIPEIQASLEKLDKSGIRILGCIVNGMQSTRSIMMGGAKKVKKEEKKPVKKNTGKKKKKKGPTKEAKENEENLEALIAQYKPEEGEKAQPEGGASAEKKPEAAEKKKKGLFGRKAKKKDAGKEGEKAETGGKDKKAKSGKKKDAKKADGKKTDDPFADLKLDVTVAPKKPRSLFDEWDDSESEHQRSDAEMTEALLRMGLDGSWDTPAKPEEGQPQSGGGGAKPEGEGTPRRRNPFEDL